MRKVKLVLYWVTVLPVVVDAVRGIVDGVRKGLLQLSNEKSEIEQRVLWERVNSGDELARHERRNDDKGGL